MNLISFRGASDVIADFAERFLEPRESGFSPLDETAERYGSLLRALPRPGGIELRHLEKVVDFLVYNDVAEDDITALIEDSPEELIALAADAAILEKYATDGTIMEAKVVEEII